MTEIERLRADRDMWKRTCTKLVGMMQKFHDEFPNAITLEDTMRQMLALKADRDRWRKIADALYLCGKCDWCREKYEQAVRGE